MESSLEHQNNADSNSTRQVVTFYSSTAEEVEQHFARALARLKSQSPHIEEGTSEILGASGIGGDRIFFLIFFLIFFILPIAAGASSLCEVRRAPESNYGSANAAFAYPQFVPFILEPDIDVTREVIKFPEEADDLSYSSCAHFLFSNPQSYAGVRVASGRAISLHCRTNYFPQKR